MSRFYLFAMQDFFAIKTAGVSPIHLAEANIQLNSLIIKLIFGWSIHIPIGKINN